MAAFEDLVNRLKEGKQLHTMRPSERGVEEGKKDFLNFRFEDFSALRAFLEESNRNLNEHQGNEPKLIALYEQFKMNQLGKSYRVKIDGRGDLQGTYTVFIGSKLPFEGMKDSHYQTRFLKGWLLGVFEIWKELPRDLFGA
jgi:hypothetical protein